MNQSYYTAHLLKNQHIRVLGTNVATTSWLHWSPVSWYKHLACLAVEHLFTFLLGYQPYNQHYLPLQLAVKAINRPVYFHQHGLTDRKYTASVCEKYVKYGISFIVVFNIYACHVHVEIGHTEKCFHSPFTVLLPFPTAEFEQRVYILAEILVQ